MPKKFIYKARNLSGKVVSGTVEAEGETGAAALLRRQKLFVLKIRPARAEPPVARIAVFYKKKVLLSELAVFCRQLATMVGAGIPILQSLTILSRQTEDRALKKAIRKIIESLESGRSLADALRAHPHIFPDIFVNMVEVGETGGALDHVLDRLAEYFEKDQVFREKIKSSLTYPVTVLFISALAVSVMLIFVLPTFAGILNDLGATVPAPTRLVLEFGGFVRRSWYVVIMFAFLLVPAFKMAVATQSGKNLFDLVILRLPVFGSVLRKVIVSRFCQTLSILLACGVHLLAALEVVKTACGNHTVVKIITEVEVSIKEGVGLATPLEKCGFFPLMVTRMIAVGEESGALESILQKVAAYYEREVEFTVTRLSSLLEPALILCVGLVVGVVIMSIMFPLFSIMAAIE